MLFGTGRLSSRDDGFVAALAEAYATRVRPRCLCVEPGVEMYVARLGEGFIAKRMPGTGSRHASRCPSFEPPLEASGLGQVLGNAIEEDPETGETTLRLGFPMSKLAGHATVPTPGSLLDSAISDGSKLSLRGLLHYLWDQAELTRWQPGFAGKRTWATVRKRLLLAADNKRARDHALRSWLYIPEPFCVEERDALNLRRLAQWSHAVSTPGKPQQLMLMIGEVKEIEPARHGYRALIKHVPDQAFAMDEQLYRRLGKRFEAELRLWASADDVHVVVIATFGMSVAGFPVIFEMSLMPVTPQWLPVEDSFDRQLVERLVSHERAFIKGLRYNLRRDQAIASAALIDTVEEGTMLFVIAPCQERSARSHSIRAIRLRGNLAAWVWEPACETFPPLPAVSDRHAGTRVDS